jgi:hypothetical protein
VHSFFHFDYPMKVALSFHIVLVSVPDGVLGDRDLPTLLTRSELSIQQRHKHCETDGVTNPPPSPATDGRENSSDWVPEMNEPLETRQLSVYDDGDILDVTCDMDVF